MEWTFNPQNIKEIRKQNYLTQEAFAKRLTMKHPQMISEWETGKSLPTIRSVLKITNEFQVPPEFFFLPTTIFGQGPGWDQYRTPGGGSQGTYPERERYLLQMGKDFPRPPDLADLQKAMTDRRTFTSKWKKLPWWRRLFFACKRFVLGKEKNICERKKNI